MEKTEPMDVNPTLKKRKAPTQMECAFLVSQNVACEDYKLIPFDKTTPRALPFPDGCYGDNPFVVIHDNGKKVTFDFQQGSTLESYNGTYPDAMIQFVKELLEFKNQGELSNRQTSVAITKLDEALQWLHARSADRHVRNVQGSYNK